MHDPKQKKPGQRSNQLLYAKTAIWDHKTVQISLFGPNKLAFFIFFIVLAHLSLLHASFVALFVIGCGQTCS